MVEIVLEEGPFFRVAVERETLLRKASEVLSDVPEQFRDMTLIEWIKADREDRLGYRKYLKVLRKAGFDVGEG